MKRLLKVVAVLVVLLLLGVAALVFLVDANHFRPMLEQKLSASLGRTVSIGDLSLALFSGGVSATDLSVSEDPAYGQAPFVTAKTLDIGVDMRTLVFERKLNVRSITIDGADISLIQKGADWNFSTLGKTTSPQAAVVPVVDPPPADPSQPVDLAVQSLRITNSRLAVAEGATKREFTDVDLELRGVSTTVAVPFTLSANVGGGGAVKVEGSAGPIAAGNSAETPFDAKVQIDDLDLKGAGFTSAASGMAGILSFNGTVNSNGKNAALNGAATIDKLKLSPKGAVASRPVAANLALAHDLKTQRGNIARSTIKLGSASATISGDYNLMPETPVVSAALSGSKLPMSELLPFLPVFGVELPTGATLEGGSLTMDVKSRGATNAMTTAGLVKIEGAKLTNYDLGSKLRIIQDLAGLPTSPVTDIQLVSTNFETSPAGTSLTDIQFIAPSIGTLTGQGTVSPQHALNFTMKAVVKTGGLLAVAIQQRGETTTVPFFITGTAAAPSFKADVKSLANEKLQQAIKNPEGAVKNARELVDSAKGILDLFKKAPKQQPQQK